MFSRILGGGTLGVGESYMDGDWDVEDLAECIARMQRLNLSAAFDSKMLIRLVLPYLSQKVFNLQSRVRAMRAIKKHYDIGNDLYEAMLGPSMTYSCGYWSPQSGEARSLDEAQFNKHDLICRKMGLKQGDRILDIGCGWGGFLEHATKHYGASGLGITLAGNQATYAAERLRGLPIEIRVQDYRSLSGETFDHIISVGMFEHVGPKNYRVYMETARRLLKDDGLFLLHTIGGNRTTYAESPWIDKYIFQGGRIPSIAQVGRAAEKLFVVEDVHNFGADYDKTLCAWFKNFERAWPDLEPHYGHLQNGQFYRMWKFYLLSCAGLFRGRYTNLWQFVLSPRGVSGGYTAVR